MRAEAPVQAAGATEWHDESIALNASTTKARKDLEESPRAGRRRGVIVGFGCGQSRPAE